MSDTRLHGLWLIRSGWHDQGGGSIARQGVHYWSAQRWVEWYRSEAVWTRWYPAGLGGVGQPRYLNSDQYLEHWLRRLGADDSGPPERSGRLGAVRVWCEVQGEQHIRSA